MLTMNRVWIYFVGIAALLLAGCSYLESYFPDKERDYQYTTEFPLINYPADLRKNQATENVSDNNAAEASSSTENSERSGVRPTTDNAEPLVNNDSSESATEPTSSAKQEVPSTPVTPAAESDERDTVSSVQIVKYDDGESRLRLGAGYPKSWRVVNKALSRNTLEVTERNYNNAQIVVQYDPDEVKAKDEGFMDEINFLFKGIGVNDRTFVLKFEEHGEQTDAIVLNEEHLPMLNDDAALRLLRLMADTIKADLAKKVKPDNESNP